ncbi:SsrA-binding protein, partial [Staphylococcus saprophyticus]|uniref:SsrA-binding protein n=1 Tax=Staphylococcus saprophyticus TaxID=29385 RepID=UPI0037042D21
MQNTIEPPILLQATQIKSSPPPSPNLKHTYPQLNRRHMFLNNIHIPPYQQPNTFNHHPPRSPNLLLHKPQIPNLPHRTRQVAYSILP